MPKSLSGVFYCKCFFLEVMYDVFCTHAQPCFLRIWLAHREELEVSNIRLNFFCWYLRKFPERHSNLRKRKQRIGGIGSVMSLRHHSLTVRFDMAVRHVMKRMTYTVTTATSPRYAKAVCNLNLGLAVHTTCKLVTRAQQVELRDHQTLASSINP